MSEELLKYRVEQLEEDVKAILARERTRAIRDAMLSAFMGGIGAFAAILTFFFAFKGHLP